MPQVSPLLRDVGTRAPKPQIEFAEDCLRVLSGISQRTLRFKVL